MIFNVGGDGSAKTIKYDNSKSGLESDNVQGAVDELTDSLSNLMNIKSLDFSGKTSSTGSLALGVPSELFPIAVKTNDNNHLMIVYKGKTDNWYVKAVYNGAGVNGMSPVTETTISGTVYYIEPATN